MYEIYGALVLESAGWLMEADEIQRSGGSTRSLRTCLQAARASVAAMLDAQRPAAVTERMVMALLNSLSWSEQVPDAGLRHYMDTAIAARMNELSEAGVRAE